MASDEKSRRLRPFWDEEPWPEPVSGAAVLDLARDLVQRHITMGEEEVDGTAAYKLKITRQDGGLSIIYLDQEHHLRFRSEDTRYKQGHELKSQTVMGDYKMIDGLLVSGEEVETGITLVAVEAV